MALTRAAFVVAPISLHGKEHSADLPDNRSHIPITTVALNTTQYITANWVFCHSDCKGYRKFNGAVGLYVTYPFPSYVKTAVTQPTKLRLAASLPARVLYRGGGRGIRVSAGGKPFVSFFQRCASVLFSCPLRTYLRLPCSMQDVMHQAGGGQ